MISMDNALVHGQSPGCRLEGVTGKLALWVKVAVAQLREVYH